MKKTNWQMANNTLDAVLKNCEATHKEFGITGEQCFYNLWETNLMQIADMPKESAAILAVALLRLIELRKQELEVQA